MDDILISDVQTLVYSDNENSQVILKNSQLSDILLYANEGTFLSRGISNTQQLINTAFNNMTLRETSAHAPFTFVDECIMNGISINNSQETFYGVLCSGLTEKTTNTFTCSNSSFIKCIRTFNPHIIFSNSDCDTYTYQNNQTMQRFYCYIQYDQLQTGHHYSFTNCKWTECISDDCDWGAVYVYFDFVEDFNASFDQCTFADCYCGSSNNGGSIYATRSDSIYIKHSSFVWTKDTPQAGDGGAVYLSLIDSVTIQDDTFIKCYIYTSGGAIMLDCSSFYNSTETSIDNCVFLKCKGDNGCGGGVCTLLNYQYDNIITNSLFSECSNVFGGVLYL